MPVTLHQTEGRWTIRLDGEIDISCAAELKDVLLRGLASEEEVQLDVEGITDLDVTGMQLLWAADKAAKGAGRKLVLRGQVPAEILALFKYAGLESFPVNAEKPVGVVN